MEYNDADNDVYYKDKGETYEDNDKDEVENELPKRKQSKIAKPTSNTSNTFPAANTKDGGYSNAIASVNICLTLNQKKARSYSHSHFCPQVLCIYYNKALPSKNMGYIYIYIYQHTSDKHKD